MPKNQSQYYCNMNDLATGSSHHHFVFSRGEGINRMATTSAAGGSTTPLQSKLRGRSEGIGPLGAVDGRSEEVERRGRECLQKGRLP